MIYSPYQHIPLGDLIICEDGRPVMRFKQKAVFDTVLIEDILNLATQAQNGVVLKVKSPKEGLRYADIRLAGGVAVLEFKYHDKTETISVAEFVSYLIANSRTAANAGRPLRDSRIAPTTENRLSC